MSEACLGLLVDRRAGPAAPLLARKVPSGARAAGQLVSSPGCARGALVHRPRRFHRGPRGPGSRQWLLPGAGGCLPTPALGSTHLVLPPFLKDPCPSSSLPAAGLNFCTCLPATRVSLLGPVFAASGRPLPPAPPRPFCPLGSAGSSSPRPAVGPVLQTFQRVPLAPERAPASSSPLWLGREGVGFELNSQGFYSILLTALLSLFFFA